RWPESRAEECPGGRRWPVGRAVVTPMPTTRRRASRGRSSSAPSRQLPAAVAGCRPQEIAFADKDLRPATQRSQDLLFALALTPHGEQTSDRLAALGDDDLAMRGRHLVEDGEAFLLETSSRNGLRAHGR